MISNNDIASLFDIDPILYVLSRPQGQPRGASNGQDIDTTKPSSGKHLRRHANAAATIPRMDLIESPTHYIVRVEVPGLPKEALSVHLEEDTLSIGIDFPEETLGEDHKRLVSERQQGGKALRKVKLMEVVDAEKVETSFKDGLLEMRLAKRSPDEKRKRIEIH